MQDPTRTPPRTDNADPKRANERNDMELVTCTKSNTEMDDANEAQPNTATPDASRVMPRSDNELPTCTESNTDKDLSLIHI